MTVGRTLVLGGGVFGVTASLELRRRGWEVTLADPGPLPRPLASSTDRSKVIRADYGTDEFLSGAAQACLDGWRRWNRERFTRPLFHEVGFLLLSRSPLEPGSFEHASYELLARRGMSVEPLDQEAIRRRFPAWSADAFPAGYLSREAGWAESGAVVEELVREAEQEGVEIVQDRAESLTMRGGRATGARLAGRGPLEADRVVVAAGAWTPELVPDPGFRASAMPVLLFAPSDPEAFRPPAFPVWGADIARTGWYGFPAGEDGIVKIGHHGRGWDGTPEEGGTVPPEWEQRCRRFLSESIPGLADAPLAGSRVCHYCDSTDGDFWIAADPERDGLVVAAGGSGHGFKFAPLLGGWIADVVEGAPAHERFRWRPRAAPGAEEARYRGE